MNKWKKHMIAASVLLMALSPLTVSAKETGEATFETTGYDTKVTITLPEAKTENITSLRFQMYADLVRGEMETPEFQFDSGVTSEVKNAEVTAEEDRYKIDVILSGKQSIFDEEGKAVIGTVTVKPSGDTDCYTEVGFVKFDDEVKDDFVDLPIVYYVNVAGLQRMHTHIVADPIFVGVEEQQAPEVTVVPGGDTSPEDDTHPENEKTPDPTVSPEPEPTVTPEPTGEPVPDPDPDPGPEQNPEPTHIPTPPASLPTPEPTKVPDPTEAPATPTPTETPVTPEPTVSPEPSTAPTVSPEPSKEPEPTVSPEPSKEPEPTVSPEPSKEPEPTVSPEPSKEPEPTVSPEPSEKPEPSVSPEPSEKPEPSVSPEPSEEPKPTVSPEPSEKPEPSVSPDPSEKPEPSVSPDPSEKPEPTVSPDPSEKPEPTVSPEPSEKPEPSVSPEPSEKPEPSVSPDPSEKPEPSVSPDPSETPDPSVSPEPSETPDPSVSPEPSVSPDPSEKPEPSVSPEPSETPDPSVSPEPSEKPEPSVSPEPSETPEPSVSPEPSETPAPEQPSRPNPDPGPVISEEGIRAEPKLGVEKVELSWPYVADADGYIIYVMDNASGEFIRLRTLHDNNITSFSRLKTELNLGGTYTFKIKTFQKREGMHSLYKDLGDVTVKLYSFDKTEKPVGKAHTKTGSKKVYLEWNEVVGADGYLIYRYNKETEKYDLIEDISGKTSLEYLGEMNDGTIYTFRMRAYAEEHGQVVKSSLSSAMKIVSTPAKTLKPSAVSSKKHQAKVTWKKVSGAKGYIVYRSTSKKGKYTPVITTSKTTFTDKKLQSGKTYYYKVRAFSKALHGNSSLGKISPAKGVKVK